MILSENGYVKIKGNRLEITRDFNRIIHSFMESDPEIFIATTASWEDTVLNTISSCDNNKLDVIQMISDSYIELEVKENSDD